MKRLGPSQQPFELSDGILAFCLYLAGVPFLTTRNLYTVETFKKLGFKGETDLLEAALECVAANKKGDLKYLFERTSDLRRLLKAFTDQQARVAAKGKDEDAGEVIQELMKDFAADKMDLDEALMRIGCLILKLRGPFLNRWKERAPLVAVPQPGKERHFKTAKADGVEYPGFTIVAAGASAQTKAHLNLS
jgi:hypothetical protein